jgi:hypothetical protein
MQVMSQGGGVTISGLDGDLRIESGGGDISLQLTHNVGHVHAESSGGSISVYVQPGMQLALDAAGAAGVTLQAGCTLSAEGASKESEGLAVGPLVVDDSGGAGRSIGYSGSGSAGWGSGNECGSVRSSEARVGPAVHQLRGGPEHGPVQMRSCRDGSCGGSSGTDSLRESRTRRLVLDAQSGSVSIMRRSWRDSVLHKLAMTSQ